MSTLTNYNVKVALDWENPPSEDKAVIFDLSENKFVLGTAGSSGITVTTDPTSQIGSVSATTLTFKNGKITGTAPNIEVDSIWFANDTLNFGQIQTPTLGGATAGFTQNGTLAKTHVTPQFSDKRTAFLTIKMDTEETQSALLEYPENFITYGDVSLEPGGPADPDDGDDDHTTEPPHTCTGKWKEQTGASTYIDLDISNIVVGDTLLALTVSIDPFVFTNGGSVTLVPTLAPLLNEVNFIIADFDGLAFIGGDYFYTFTVTSVTYDGTTSFEPGGFCVYNNGRRSTILTVGGDSTLGQLSLRSTGSVSPDPRSGLMLTSAPNILFFQPDAKVSPSGSFQPISASAAIDFSLTDGSLSLKVSGTASASEPPKTMLYVSKSGDEPRIGIGTKNPIQAFDVQETKDNSEGTQFLLRSARTTTKGADPGDAAGSINFIIDSGSYNNLLESGSMAKITTEVLQADETGVTGKLIFQTATSPKLEPTTVMTLFNGQGGSSIDSSLEVDGFLKADKIALGTVAVGNVSSGGIGISGDLSVLGNTSLGNQSSDTHEFNGSITASNDISASGDVSASRLTLESSGSTLFNVVGSQGQLFSITDSLSGSLFAVSDVSGLPILEVFSDDTVKMGSFNNEAIIVSGSNATITGSITGSFVGDGSGLTGVGTVDTTGTPANNQIAIFTDTDTIEGDADLTFDGSNLTVSGDIEAESILVKTTGISSTGDYGAGSRIYIGSDVGTISAGKVYYLASTGWELSNSNASSTATGFLAVRTSTGTTSVSGMLIEGNVKVGTNLSSSNVGDKVYLLNAGGALTTTLPTTSGLYVRIVGYVVTPSTSVIYFNPSPDYIELV